MIIDGPKRTGEECGLDHLQERPRLIVFDEIHKYSKWKDFLKGFFDVYAERTRIVVTGSSRLDLFKKGGDSLMGRYFLCHVHPLSVREIMGAKVFGSETYPPLPVDPKVYVGRGEVCLK